MCHWSGQMWDCAKFVCKDVIEVDRRCDCAKFVCKDVIEVDRRWEIVPNLSANVIKVDRRCEIVPSYNLSAKMSLKWTEDVIVCILAFVCIDYGVLLSYLCWPCRSNERAGSLPSKANVVNDTAVGHLRLWWTIKNTDWGFRLRAWLYVFGLTIRPGGDTWCCGEWMLKGSRRPHINQYRNWVFSHVMRMEVLRVRSGCLWIYSIFSEDDPVTN